MYPGLRRVAYHAGNVLRDAAGSIDRAGMRLQGSIAYRETRVFLASSLSCVAHAVQSAATAACSRSTTRPPRLRLTRSSLPTPL